MRLKFILIAALLMAVGYGIMWHMQAGAVRDHVESSLLELRQKFKQTNPNVRIQWDEIMRSGFPFSPSATITSPTLSMVHGGASYSVGFAQLRFAPGGVAGIPREGVYVVVPSAQEIRALYAEPNHAPEEYRIRYDAPVELKMLAYKPGVTPQRCLPGQPCNSLPDDAYPLSHLRVGLPASIILMSTLGNESKPIQFRFSDLQRAAAGMDMPIPADVTYPLSIFVGMLREAHIYQ